MGHGASKMRKSKRRPRKGSIRTSRRSRAKKSSAADLLRMRDEDIIRVVRKDLNENPETFVLNNVLMCTMFLKNYQEEIGMASLKATSAQESSFWEPTVIMERANSNVIFRPMHGPNKNIAEPLVTRRIYVPMNEYVEVFDPNCDDRDADEPSTSPYQVRIEDSKRPGFVKLQRINDLNNHDGTSMKDIAEASSSNISGSSDADSVSTFTGTETKEESHLQSNDSDTLDDCFVFRKIKKADADLQLEDMDCRHLTEEDVYDVVSYLPSRQFMKYFQKVFKNSIANQLSINQDDIGNGMPGKICCSIRDENGNFCPVEVLPCLKCPWPYKQTFHLSEGTPGAPFQWPTDDMLNKMKRCQCVLVPKGYSKRRGEYPEGDLEWEIHFPLAERYLESFLLPEQLNCYFILLAIHKEYIQPYTKSLGVLPEHFLSLILGEAEANYTNWASHQLGPRLLGLIEKFSNSLKNRKLRHYFIRNKNMLRNPFARKHLERANEKFHRIKQSPLMMIIRALRNVRYTSGSFYPPLDYKKLLRILYEREWWDDTNHLSRKSESEEEFRGSAISLHEKPKFNDAVTQLAYVNALRQKEKLMEKQKKLNGRRGSVDSINDDWECEKRLDRPKKVALLKLFIKQHWDMASTSLRIATKTQALFYLKQAWYLTKILKEENPLWAEEAVNWLNEIRREEEKIICESQFNIQGNAQLDKAAEDLDATKMGHSSEEKCHVDAEQVHQQVGRSGVNLKTLTRSFSKNYFQKEPAEDMR